MNKKILTVACLAIVVTSFAGCDMGGDKGEKKVNESKTESTSESKTESKIESKTEQDSDSGDGNYFETMTDLIARGKSMKCIYHQEIDDKSTADGVVYTADGNARVEIMMDEGTDREGKMYAIMNKDYHYSWVDGSSTGYKITAEAAELDEEMKDSVSKMTDKIDYKCKSWKKDNSKFKTPSNIVFEDLSEMMEGLGDVDMEEELKHIEENYGDEFICDFCKNAPASEQEECLDGVVCDWQ